MAGRPPEGPGLAERLEGPDENRRKLKIILETITGDRTIADAAAAIGVGAARFHELRTNVLQAALDALRPKAAGRPRQPIEPPDPAHVAELESRVRELSIELRAAHVREQLALTMPHLLQGEAPVADEAVKKKTRRPSKVLDRIRKDKGRRG